MDIYPTTQGLKRVEKPCIKYDAMVIMQGRASFLLKGVEVAYFKLPHVNLSAGDSITIQDLKGKLTLEDVA